jgi:hypothetical protein
MNHKSIMSQKLGAFLRPHRLTIFVFAVLILLTPVLYITSEPERTNYRPGEEQHWLIKTTYYGSPLGEYLFHTNGYFDAFIEIIATDYLSNYIGILLITCRPPHEC